MSNRQWDSKNGHNEGRWGSTLGGIPNNKPLWHTQVPVGLSFGNFVIYEDTCYVQDDSHNIHAVDLSGGKELWVYHNSSLTNDYYNISASDQVLAFGPVVLDRNSGLIIIDFQDLVEGDVGLQDGFPIIISNDRLIRAWSAEVKPGVYIVYDLINKSRSDMRLNLFGMQISDKKPLAIGWREVENSYSLVALDLNELDQVWVSDKVNIGRIFLQNDKIFSIGNFGVDVLELGTGQLIWRKSLSEVSADLNADFISQYIVMICDDSLHICSPENIVSMSIESSEILWKKEVVSLRDSCISGDIIFGMHNDNHLFALDRYTGSEIWSIDTEVPWNSVKSHDDNLLLSFASGDIACYKFKNVYRSPAKLS